MKTLASIAESILGSELDSSLEIPVMFAKLTDILKPIKFKKAGIFETRAGSYIYKGRGVGQCWLNILKVLNIPSLSKYKVKKVSDNEDCTVMYTDVKGGTDTTQIIYIHNPLTEELVSIEFTGKNMNPYLALTFIDPRYAKSALKTHISGKYNIYKLPSVTLSALKDAVS